MGWPEVRRPSPIPGWRRTLPSAVAVLLLVPACGDEGGGSRGAGAIPDRGDSPVASHPNRPLGSLDPGFVGDAACVACHGDVVDRYRETNHGRSLTAFSAGDAPERFPPPSPPDAPAPPGWVQSPMDDLLYRAEVRDGELLQRELLVDAGGRPVHELALEADQVIGSGNQTRSYLMIRNGRVTQMPLTWYAHQERWDMSPGYAEANDRFSRPIILQCLACHGDLPVREPFTQNLFRELPGAISCERCHGPGAEHVERRSEGEVPESSDGIRPGADGGRDGAPGSDEGVQRGEGAGAPDPWIVNPAHLDRSRQMSVCTQCHLAGVIAYPDGEDATTFRPGMDLSENRAVFVPSLQLEDPDWVGIDSHPIRLARSACYENSEMTCLTCHLPHTSGEALPVDHYQRQCLSCHTTEAPGTVLCSRPDAATPDQAMSGDCVSCHMTAGGTSDVPHVRFTDHWILRRPRPPLPPEAGRPAIDSPDPLPLVEVSAMGVLARPELLLHRSDALQASLRAEALFHFYETMHRHPGYLPEVVLAGREAQRSAASSRGAPGGDPPTAEGRLALGRALLELDSVDAAEGVLAEALVHHPDDPWGHFLLGALLDERRGRPADALPHLDRALELQPFLNEARAKRAEVRFALGRPSDALRDLERVVEEEPLHRPRAWFNLGIVRIEMGDAEGAEAAFEEAARTDPRNAEPPIQLGTLQMARGALELAETTLRRGVAADPEHPGAHGSLALVLLERGRTDEAREHLRRVMELDPGNQPARELLQRIGG